MHLLPPDGRTLQLTLAAVAVLSLCIALKTSFFGTGQRRLHVLALGSQQHLTISVLPLNMTEPAGLRVQKYCSSIDWAESQYAMPYLLEQQVRALPSYVDNPMEADIVVVPAYPVIYGWCDVRPSLPAEAPTALMASKLLPAIQQLPNTTVLVFALGHVDDFPVLNTHFLSKIRLEKPRRIVTLRTDMGDTLCACYGRSFWGDGLENLMMPYAVMQPLEFISAQARSLSTVQKNLTLYFNAGITLGGVLRRQELVASYQALNRRDIDVALAPNPRIKHWQYVNNIKRAKFCLAPEGDVSTTLRLFEAIVAECIPVILSDCMDLPFEGLDPVGNYSSFSLRFPLKTDARTIMAKIDDVLSSGEYERLASRLREVWPYFTMHNGSLPQPSAGPLIVRELFSAANRIKEGLPPLSDNQTWARHHCSRGG